MVIEIFKAPPVKDWKIFRIHPAVIVAVLYLSYCFTAIFDTQGFLMGLPSMLSQMPNGLFGLSGNAIRLGWWVYLLGGAIPLLLFEVLARIYSNMLRNTFPHFESAHMRHILRFFFIGRNIVLGFFNLIYIHNPIVYNLGTLAVEFIITTGFCFLFYLYFSRKNLPSFLYGKSAMVFASPYLGYYVVLLVISVIGGLFL